MSANATTGEAPFVYAGESFKTWYTVFGDLHSGTTPLVLVHGGPGIPHNYLLPLRRFATERGIPVVLYDQVGCGRSTHLRDRPAEFWTVAFFAAELRNLLAHLRIDGSFDLLGHSWGGMLVMEFAVAEPRAEGLRKLVVSDSLASMPLWEVSVNKLLKRFPQEVQDAVKRHEAEGTTDSEEYQAIMQDFYKRYICRLDPWPQELVDSFAAMEQDPAVYSAMLGASEFNITGTLKTWSMLDRLHTINTPTLIINSVHDEAQDECVGPLFQKIPKAKWVQFADSAHMPWFEEPERFFKVVSDFLVDRI